MTELRRTTISSVILIFGFLLTGMWQFFAQIQTPVSLHPLNPIEYTPKWYVVFLADCLRPLIYTIVVHLKPALGVITWIFICFEGMLFLDFIFTYRQTPVRMAASILMIFVILIHYYSYYDAYKKNIQNGSNR